MMNDYFLFIKKTNLERVGVWTLVPADPAVSPLPPDADLVVLVRQVLVGVGQEVEGPHLTIKSVPS